MASNDGARYKGAPLVSAPHYGEGEHPRVEHLISRNLQVLMPQHNPGVTSELPISHYGMPVIYLQRDADHVGSLGRYSVNCFTDATSAGDPASPGFVSRAEIHIPRLDHIVSASGGKFCELALDIRSIADNDQSRCKDEISVTLPGGNVVIRVMHKWYQSSQIFIPLWKLYKDKNEVSITVRPLEPRRSSPYYSIRLMLSSKTRVLDTLEKDSIWIFSPPRSGTTWLAQDILGWTPNVRPMDETGLGRMLSPLQLGPERLLNFGERTVPFESGPEFERGWKPRTRPGIPPFVRQFPEDSRTEPFEQILATEHKEMFCRHVRKLALDHVLHVWGFLGFQRVAFKCTDDSQAADLIMAAFPNAHLIFLIRDGRDALRSQCSPFISGALFAEAGYEVRRQIVAFYSHLWNFRVDIIRAAFEAHAPERRLMVCYEDLRREPMRTIHALFRHLGMSTPDQAMTELVRETTLENMPAEMKGPDKPRQSGEIGGYKRFFTEPEIHLMNAIMGENLRRYGYGDS